MLATASLTGLYLTAQNNYAETEQKEDITKVLKDRDQILKTELEDTKNETLKNLLQVSEEEIAKMKGEEQENEIINRGGEQFRKVTLLDVGVLKNGGKLSISVSNANNKELFEP